MKQKRSDNMKNKIGLYFLIIVMLMCSGLFVFLFINCINLYHSFDLSYDDVIYEANLKLYINEKQVAKKFIALG